MLTTWNRKTKELLIDFRKKGSGHLPLIINNMPIQQVDTQRFPGFNISVDLTLVQFKAKPIGGLTEC